LGLIESTVLRTNSGIAVEISSGLKDVVDLLRTHLQELTQNLEPYGLTGIEIVQKKPQGDQRAGVDVVV